MSLFARLIPLAIATLLCLPSGAVPPEGETALDAARARVERAKAEAKDSDGQARALTLLAWPDSGPPEPLVSSLAREQLVEFGAAALAALKESILRVDPLYTADATSALLEARYRVTSGAPNEYLPALIDAVWSDSADAKRIAIPELARLRFSPAMLACTDAAVEHPGLTELVIRALGALGDYRAQYYLSDVLEQGSPALRVAAAESLAKIGGAAMVALHEGALSADPDVRRPAIRALIPASGVNELTVLYEYLALYADDEPELAEQIRSRATALESLLEQRLDYDSASPTGD